MKKLPTLWYERRLWNRGYRVVAGLDEVGRGAWAGPLVVGAVAFSRELCHLSNLKYLEKIGIDDSKRLSKKRRAELAEVIKKEALAWSVAEIPAAVINRVGIGPATQMGLRKAVSNLRRKFNRSVDYVVTDAFHISRLAGLPIRRSLSLSQSLNGKTKTSKLFLGKGRQLAMVKGDQRVLSIAAASIVAKVHRDALMVKFAGKHAGYGWERNVGYGTPEHQRGLRKLGLTRLHRIRFVATGMGTNSA
jgi:ribonuclease HII